ncbi:potassium/proton antiporter, CPA1 family [Desulfonispora thiosulfatigenes DSM 11270]|uniref:Potassium/proton antiporter, CPA1 family n=1 Tax=Desulfonispora thiosulfatigenes DSM 11270 TaxID=656914 RepID=A0A1W1V3P5_DESTI|nr:potassium/proton antiporter [Desulfonispora thiosulfatigenes]SMB87910.1 potassium/proton antiporter, CPA1 family [Desulfonispora thiosulfatigenes DSM 11270]
MNLLFIAGVILLLCALSSKVLYRYGIPTLIAFLAIGMIMGSEGIGGIQFDNIELTQFVCNIGLIYIMFSGGFGTSWKTAKPVARAAGVLATLGVVLTAFLIGIFAHFALKLSFLEGMLLGSIISSTDAASVFSILRSKSLNLKNGLAPLLEMESGSNDPMAYMLTTIFIGLIVGQGNNIFLMLITQIVVGALVGVIVAKSAVWLINNINLDIDSLYSIIVIAVAILSFSGASLLSGNGFLAVYITGLIMGNKKLVHKVSLVRYFDGISWLMQILLFFTLGLLVSPSAVINVMVPGIATAIFIIFIARPIAMLGILYFCKTPIKDQLLVSWVGFRGAASIVFATYPLNAGIGVADYIFNIVFFVALVSVLVQGTLLVPIAKKLDLLSEDETVLKTFTDYSGEIHAELLEINIPEKSSMVNKKIMDLDIPIEILIVMIKREGKIITPKGNTVIKSGDTVMLAGKNKEQLFAIDTKFNQIHSFA